MTNEEKVAEIINLEIEASKLEQHSGGKFAMDDKSWKVYIKIIRKLCALRDSL